ncbi:cytochrome c peroxidase [Dokdonia sp. Hel_I_53]|uniref:cytochrome c peroxidase n=1 Tax=Dokdonia sp. Hel_I_53 TaxID=1566287 RepID=UPI00119AA025|nr:cytochrome c peroxidase [Dokdonia sp. Hel_I_53]TVZ53339.1 cytochrome c peroxidase [Dokdonia sp. Hel_I_53]
MTTKVLQYFILGLFGFFSILSCDQKENYSVQIVPDWDGARAIYLSEIKKTIKGIDSLATIDAQDPNAKAIFKNTRIAFKKAEPYASYLNPPVGHRVNGPALPIYKEDNGKTLHPVGFQKIEESIYDGGTQNSQYQGELKTTKGLLLNLQKNIEKRALNPQRYFIATHQQLFRIMSFSITGFDTPVSHLGILESGISLENLRDTYNISLKEIIESKDPDLSKTFLQQIQQAVSYIKEQSDFATFDRYTFIQQHFTPITKSWLRIRQASNLWSPVTNQPFNYNAPTFFQTDAYNASYFMPNTNQNQTPAQIALGKKLFNDVKLSANETMSCATCHIPEKGYADARKVSISNKGQLLKRNTPTLLNTIFQQNFFWDGRSSTIIDQVSSVFLNKDEFNSGVHQFSNKILGDPAYQDLFTEAYGGISTRNTDVIKAISSYVATLNGFNSKFDKNMRDDERSFTRIEKKGLNLFMGKALCATCHFVPLTNGTVPPFFSETEREVIGVPATSANEELDDDLGYYPTFEEEKHRGMFKTPTVRNASLTAPYMHNGVYSTLDEVLDFYNKGGGAGLGFDLPHQTLPFDELELSQEEIEALIAFLKTLDDTNVENNS